MFIRCHFTLLCPEGRIDKCHNSVPRQQLCCYAEEGRGWEFSSVLHGVQIVFRVSMRIPGGFQAMYFHHCVISGVQGQSGRAWGLQTDSLWQ